MKEDLEIIGRRAIRNRVTGEIVTDLSPIYVEDWPYRNVSPNQPLLRYMDFWKFEDLIKSQELYFCRADKLEDPLEGTLSKKGVHGTSKSDRAFGKNIQLEDGAYEKALKYRGTAKSCTFINCWHINVDECQEMWKAYTSSPDSVLLITTAGRLAASLKQPVFGSAVKYVTDDTPRTEFGERSLFFYKDMAYKFECEFRLLVDLMSLGGSIHSDHPDDFFRRIPVDLKKLVYAIQLHPNASGETKEKIEALVRTYLPSAVEVPCPQAGVEG